MGRGLGTITLLGGTATARGHEGSCGWRAWLRHELPAELHWALSFLHRLINPDLQKKAAGWGPLNRLSRLLICLR